MSKKKEIIVDEYADLDPRISRSFGVTIGIGDFQFVRASVSLEANVPESMTVDEFANMMEQKLIDDLNVAIDRVMDEYFGDE